MIQARGPGTVRITKVKGHTTDDEFSRGQARAQDQYGDDQAHDTANLGKEHLSAVVMDAKRAPVNGRVHWYRISLELHKFMVAVSRVDVNHDCRGLGSGWRFQAASGGGSSQC